MCMYVYIYIDLILPLDVEFGQSGIDSSVEEISSMVNFLIANRSKIMQICMGSDKNLDLDTFDLIFQKIVEKDITTALTVNIKVTALILDILDNNKIKN